MLDSPFVRRLIGLAIDEDLSFGDVTSEVSVPARHESTAVVIARQDLIFCGADLVELIRAEGRWDFSINLKALDGDSVSEGTILIELCGQTRELLSAERTVLNFLQRMSGVATFTRNFMADLGGAITVLDTRKTMPGWRVLDKFAVRIGGAKNHRFSLGDMVLVKNNHIDGHPNGMRGALADVVAKKPPYMSWEVEVRNIEELQIALEFSPTIVMLDNFTNELITDAMSILKVRPARPLVEVSGGITSERAKTLSAYGIDAVSAGSLTTSAPNVDISMRITSTLPGV